MRTDFDSVIQSWRTADPNRIHPLRAKSIDDYWSSGEAQAVEAATYIPDDGTVIDFGCGDGRLAIPLSLLGFDVLAVDSSPEMLERLHENAMREEAKVSSRLSNGLDLVVKKKVDAVVCRAVLIHHSHDDGARLVAAFSRTLRKGGHLIADWPTGRSHERRDWIDVTVWDPQERLAVAQDVGLELVDDGTPSVWIKR